MRVSLIREDEAPVSIRVGDTVLFVRRVPESKRREIAAACRREILLRAPAGDREAANLYVEALDDRTLDYAITGWRRLEGDPPCVRENKAALPESVKDLVRAYMGAPAAGESAADAAEDSGAPLATPAS